MENTQKVIWIPRYSGNRTAFLSRLTPRTENNFKNKDENGVYPVAPFKFWKSEGKYYSENPNCGTDYLLLEVPSWFTQNHLNDISNKLCKNLNKNYGLGSEIRVLKIGREDLILDIISTLN